MSTPRPLPPECLAIIVRHLAAEHDITSLATLLRVNHYICSVTVPILYQNPFQIIVPLPRHHKHSQFLSKLLKLTRTLLLSLPENHIVPDGLRIAYLSDPDSDLIDNDQEGNIQLTRTLFPYYSFLSDISFEGCTTPRIGLFQNQLLNSNQAFRDYLQSRPADPDLIFWGTRFDILAEDAGRELRRDLTWTLCANAKRIKSVVMPLYDIDRYLSAIAQFKALSEVVFYSDSQYKPANMSSSEEEGVRRFQQSKRTPYLEKMILFIQEHRRLHGATLESVQYSSSNGGDDLPHEFRQRVFQLLGPLKDPLFLDARNWEQFLATFQETNLSFVKTICSDLEVTGDAVMEQLAKLGPYLHRCRTLDSFVMDSASDDMFQWAVDERRIYDAKITAGQTPHTLLVPLRVFNVAYYHKSFGRQLNDVVFAFNKTLETITANCYWEPMNVNEQDFAEFVVGNSFANWDLPNLKKLNISTNDHLIHLRITPNLLLQLPQLTHLALTDKREQYKRSEIVYWHAASLPELVQLQLEGTPAISFNPETLRSTRNLVRMELRMVVTELDLPPYVPPAEEFEECFVAPTYDMTAITTAVAITGTEPTTFTASATMGQMSIARRLLWTWDWELPKLTSLFLNAEVAYLFQFRMLAGTPNLKYFLVDSRTHTEMHPRTIVLSDLLVPGVDRHPALATVLEKERQFQEKYASENDLKRDIGAAGEFLTGGNYLAQEWKVKDGEDDDDTQEEHLQEWFDFEYIELPALVSFALRGTWTISRRTLAVLFGRMIPNVKELEMHGSRGYSGADFVGLSWKYLLKLEEAFAALNFDPESIGMTMSTCANEKFLDPFIFRRLGIDHGVHDSRTPINLMHLIRVLLQSVPKDRISPLLQAAYLDNTTEASVAPESEEQATAGVAARNNDDSLPQIPYYTFLTTVGFHNLSQSSQAFFHSRGIFYNQTLISNVNLSNELSQGGYSEQYLLEDIYVRLHYKPPEKVIALGAARELHHDLTWALSTNAENICTLVFGPPDVSRYLEQVHRFNVLSDVTFLIDRNLSFQVPFGEVLSTQDEEILSRQRLEQKQHFEEVVLFVKEHRRIHPGVLKVARCIPHNSTTENFSMEYHDQLFPKNLPPLERPLSIDSVNWPHFVAKIQDTALSFVRNYVPDFLSASTDILQYVADLAAGRNCVRPLVPLRNFSASYCHPTKGRQLNDVLYAFSGTLETVSATIAGPYIEDDTQGPREILIGHDNDDSSNSFWGLPRLTTLYVNTCDNNLRAWPDFMSRYQQLKRVSLHDRNRDYFLNDVVHW
ncbi:hypothetical protein EC991_003284 [Linnemannia zychae]|nr:hypothetical protein EC991_003284 [Linnemannia zychae]